MKLKNILSICVLLALVLGAAGCDRMPVAEMDNARDAVFRAENDEDAVVFGTAHLARARDALRRMQVEADSRRFDAARTHAAEAVAAAERAISEGRAGADRARSESASLLANLMPEIEETERNINGARYAQLDVDYNALYRDLDSVRANVSQAEASHAEGNYSDALENGRRARAVLGDINGRIAGASVRGKS